MVNFKKVEKDTLFLNTLCSKVNTYFLKNKIRKTGNLKLRLKAVILFALYIMSYVLMFFAVNYSQLVLLFCIHGMLTIFLALNVAHDAAHNTFSSKKKINNLLLYTFDLLGASGYMWRLKHVFSHHPHVNIPNMDGDIKQSNLVRIFPKSKFLNFHKVQHFYMPVLYLFYTMIWLLFRDFKDFFKTDISGKPKQKHPRIEYVKLIAFKTVYFGRMIFIPYLLLPFSFTQILIANILFHFVAGFTTAMALISAHIGLESVYPEPDKMGNMDISWVRHQLITTSDFATKSKIVTSLFGGFNHHVIHHIFPTICHIHYPKLTHILIETCKEFNMPYNSNTTLLNAAWSHLKFLKMRSKNKDLSINNFKVEKV